MRAAWKESEDFSLNAGVHQGSALSYLRFVVIVEEATKESTGEASWHLPYTDDLVLPADFKKEVEEKFLV